MSQSSFSLCLHKLHSSRAFLYTIFLNASLSISMFCYYWTTTVVYISLFVFLAMFLSRSKLHNAFRLLFPSFIYFSTLFFARNLLQYMNRYLNFSILSYTYVFLIFTISSSSFSSLLFLIYFFFLYIFLWAYTLLPLHPVFLLCF